MSLIKFGNYTPTEEPSTYSVTISDLDSDGSGRSETGVMTRKRIRAGLYKISVGWTNIDDTLRSAILSAISGSFFSVTFDDGSEVTQQMYVSDRSNELKYTDASGTRYWDVSFDLVSK